MAVETGKNVVAIARLIGDEEQVHALCTAILPGIRSAPLRDRIEKVANRALLHAEQLRQALGLPAPRRETESPAAGVPDSSGGAERPTTWRTLVGCSRIEEGLADGCREAASQATDRRLSELLSELATAAADDRNEVSLVAALVTSFVS